MDEHEGRLQSLDMKVVLAASVRIRSKKSPKFGRNSATMRMLLTVPFRARTNQQRPTDVQQALDTNGSVTDDVLALAGVSKTSLTRHFLRLGNCVARRLFPRNDALLVVGGDMRVGMKVTHCSQIC
jgi:hypothetical protein